MSAETGAAAAAPDPVEELVSLVRRAEAEGDTVLPEVRAFFDAHPDVATKMGDAAGAARLALADLAAAGSTVTKEAVLRRAAALEADLAGEGAGPLERVLAGHVATCWLAACEAEITAAGARGAAPPRANFLDQRRDRAGRRLEGAVKTLALVKKLLRPAVSPLDIATRAAHGRRAGARQNGRQEVPVAAGVPVAN
jgi:hypothetical protein